MNRILSIVLVLASTLAAAGSSSAQEMVVKATVPFNFTVRDHTLPAGTYRISSPFNSANVLALSNRDKNAYLLTMGRAYQANPKHADVLVFHKYGNQYFLSQIRSKQGSINIDLPVTKAEKRVRTQVEEAGRFVDDPVLIALN